MKSRLQIIINHLYQLYFPWLGILAVFSLPLRLTAAYVFFFPALLIWLLANILNLRSILAKSPLGARLLLFYLIAFLSAPFGINPGRSLQKLPMAAVYALSIFMFQDLVRKAGCIRTISALLAGQAISSFYSLIESASRGHAPQLFVGTVSESGQLAMTLIVALGLIIETGRRTAPAPLPPQPRQILPLYCGGWMRNSISGLSLLVFALLAFSYYFRLGQAARLIVTVGAGLLAGLGWLWMLSSLPGKEINFPRLKTALVACVLPLMSVALLANLKRGPWLGVFTGGFLLLILCRKKYTFSLIIGALAALLVLQPVRARLAYSYRDFVVTGGRRAIWRVGSELLTTYPLGIGYKNSGFLREFAPEVPPELRHFHNTGLNILIETGWVGFFLFLWWIWGLLQSAFRTFRRPPLQILSVSIGCAVVSWLAAGTVEHNFGDSEVVMVLYLLTGILAYSNQPTTAGASSCDQSRSYPP